MSYLIRRRLPLLVSAALLLAAAPQFAFAQGKQVVQLQNLVANKPLNAQQFLANPKLIQPLRGQMLQLAQNGKPQNPQETEAFDTYFLVRIAELTWPALTATSGAEQRRMQIKREARQFSTGQSQEFHDRLNQHLLGQLPLLAADAAIDLNARYNALLLLGQVDRIEPNATSNIAAVPLAEVTPLLVGEFDKQDFPEALRIAALIGLARQSELQVVAGARPAIAGVAAKLIASKKPLAGFTTNGHHWARKLALQMVTGLAKSGSDMNRPETVKALFEILNDDQEPLFLRRDAALALGNLDPTTIASGNTKPLDLLKALSRLARETLKAGTPRPDPTVEPVLSKGDDVFLPPSEETKKHYTDGLSYYLNCIATGLGGRNTRGLKAATTADPNTNKLVNELITYVDGAVLAMGSSKVTALALPQDMSRRGGELAAWMTKNGLDAQPAAAAVPAPANAAVQGVAAGQK